MSWHQTLRFDYLPFSWSTGAEKNEIVSLEKELGFQLPDSLKDTYPLFNGSNNRGVLGLGYRLSMDQVRDVREMYLTGKTEGTLMPDSEAHPPVEIKQVWWNPLWIPVLDTAGGSVFCIDLDPTEQGIAGQFIRFRIEDGPVEVLASSFEDYLTKFANDIQNGVCVFDSESGDLKYKKA